MEDNKADKVLVLCQKMKKISAWKRLLGKQKNGVDSNLLSKNQTAGKLMLFTKHAVLTLVLDIEKIMTNKNI